MPVSSKFLTGLSLLIALAGCSDSASETKVAPKAALPVEIFIVGNQSAEREINAVGTVRYRRETPLGFTTAGKVAVVRFEEGDVVKRGALLAALDTTTVGADMSVGVEPSVTQRGMSVTNAECTLRIVAVVMTSWG